MVPYLFFRSGICTRLRGCKSHAAAAGVHHDHKLGVAGRSMHTFPSSLCCRLAIFMPKACWLFINSDSCTLLQYAVGMAAKGHASHICASIARVMVMVWIPSAELLWAVKSDPGSGPEHARHPANACLAAGRVHLSAVVACLTFV